MIKSDKVSKNHNNNNIPGKTKVKLHDGTAGTVEFASKYQIKSSYK